MSAKRYRLAWIVLIMLVATFLRLYALTDVPPGMTHDEADHGMAAWGVYNGLRPLYFTVGYGREPLYDYLTAGLMSFLGPTYLAGRLTSVFFGLLMIAGSYAWARRVAGPAVGLITAAGLAVGFWPVMVARQALRTVTLPAVFVLAMLFFWNGLRHSTRRPHRLLSPSYVVAGALLGISFYTYIPARATWLVFPAVLLYLALTNRQLFAQAWRGTVLALVLAMLLALPLFLYLQLVPEAEVRIDQLVGPLLAARTGDFAPLLRNAWEGLQTLTVEGDLRWRYNIAGKPMLPLALSIPFYAGLGIAVAGAWIGRRVQEQGTGRAIQLRPGPLYGAGMIAALVWLLLGILPVLVTGPELSTTQAAAMQPVLYLFPALALVLGGRWLAARGGLRVARAAVYGLVALFLVLGVATGYDYFVRWANEPEVRTEYETTLVTTIRYLNENGSGAVAFSSRVPDQYHDPATAQMYLTNKQVSLRWFNGEHSLLLPQDGAGRLVFTGHAPLNPALAAYLPNPGLVTSLPMRTTDDDRPVSIYAVDGSATLETVYPQFQPVIHNGSTGIDFGEGITLLGYDLNSPEVRPGGQLQLASLWRVRRPISGEHVFFTHLVGLEDVPVAQADRLGVPSQFWHPGDVFVQLHEMSVPAALEPGRYSLAVGVYARENLQRWPVYVAGEREGDLWTLTEVVVRQ